MSSQVSDSDSGGRARRHGARRAKRSRKSPADDVGVGENDAADVDGYDDTEDHPAEEPASRTRNGRKGRKAGKGRAAGRDTSATEDTIRSRRSASASGADPVSKFSASALRRVTVLGDGPSDIVYKLAEQSQRKRGTVVLGTLLALCAMALVTLGGVLLYQFFSGEPIGTESAESAIVDPPSGHSTLLPEVFQGTDDTEDEVFDPIAERPGDAEPLTEDQVFSSTEELELDDTKITLRDSEVTDTCTSLVWGDELAQTLADNSCYSAASGVYQDPDDEYVAQFALFDLADESASREVNKAFDPTDTSTESGFLLPQDTSIDGLQEGHSQATTQVMGHYLAVYWVARADGGQPDDGTAMAELNVVAMNASTAVYEEVSTAREDEE